MPANAITETMNHFSLDVKTLYGLLEASLAEERGILEDSVLSDM